MKVSVMTWFQYHNYGTALQVTALCDTIKKLGHKPFVIDYKMIINNRNVKSPVILLKPNTVVNLWNRGKRGIKNHFYHQYTNARREEKFENFLNNNLQFTDCCKLQSDLEALNGEYDAFVCGSDQIWSPPNFDPHYFLDFVRDENRMIAYAPSVGLSEIEDINVQNRMAECASRFHYLSTREISGSELIYNLTGKKVETVLDPTFLLDQDKWKKFAGDFGAAFEPYLLVYMLGHNESHWKKIYKIANTLHLDVKIIPVFAKDIGRSGCINEAIGPEDFLSLVMNASYVCTDSFHGLAFALNFNKQFSVFERFKAKDKMNQNSRIYNILNLLGLQSRLIGDKIPITLKEDIIDYESVNEALDTQRQKSLSFLKSALDAVEEYTAPVVKNNVLNFTALCCGCGACEAACPTKAIEVKFNSEGFYQAELTEEKCVSCGKCKNVCPYINHQNDIEIMRAKLYSYIDSDAEVLQRSSSGGMAYRMAMDAAQNGISVAGCVFDAAEHKAVHMILPPEKSGDVNLFQGSKYMQSAFAPIMEHIQGKCMVFGTPCQIAGARNFCGANDDILFVDLICHGVPTYNLYKKYLTFLNAETGMDVKGNVKTIFRYKPKGWRERYIYNENSEKRYCASQHKDPYFLAFEHGVCYSKGCYECPWRDRSAADIRLGDYWHTRYKNNKTGVSMVAALTERGQQYMEKFTKSKCGLVKEELVQDYFACQQTVNYPRPVFWEELIAELQSESSMESICKAYVRPFETRRRILTPLHRIWTAVKRHG